MNEGRMRDKEIKKLLDNNEFDHKKGGKTSLRTLIMKKEVPIDRGISRDVGIIEEKMTTLGASSRRSPSSKAKTIPRLT